MQHDIAFKGPFMGFLQAAPSELHTHTHHSWYAINSGIINKLWFMDKKQTLLVGSQKSIRKKQASASHKWVVKNLNSTILT